MRLALIAGAGLLIAGCSHLPEWSVGPPYGEDLAVEHHAADSASAERTAEYVEIDSWDDHERCLAALAEASHGEIVRVSPVEARAWHTDHGVTHEHACTGGTLLRRSWGGEAAAHH